MIVHSRPRDFGVDEMIRHLDQQERRERPDLLTKKEWGAIEEEIRKCQASFEYTARNYFWITTKRGEDVLLNLNDSQCLLYEKIQELKKARKAQKIFLLKARQLGASTLVEAIIAWRTMFFPNIEALVVSVDETHTASLFGKMLHIYDMLPWWLKPMLATREYKGGIWFANRDETQRRYNPGMNSRVTVQHSTQVSGIGQGRTVHIVHISELSDWLQSTARKTMEGDLKHALPNNDETLAVIETTGRGAGGYCEKLWTANTELGDDADWMPVFIPWFFEPNRVLAPDQGWRPTGKELDMKERVAAEWVRCEHCHRFMESMWHRIPLVDTECPSCSKGMLRSYQLTDEQLYFMRRERLNHEAKGQEAIKELKQELATTPQDAFQLSGIQIFPADCMDFVNSSIRPPMLTGYLDKTGRLHGVTKGRKCYQKDCEVDHIYDEERPLRLWELPDPNARYTIGVDVAEGLGGEYDYSVAVVNKIGSGPLPDRVVAVFRTNSMDQIAFATPVVQLGHFYNTAMLSIEYNGGQSCADTVRIRHLYPNLFRWKHYDSAYNQLSHRWHWCTQLNTKPKLWQTARRWLRAKLWITPSANLYEEMKRFQKDAEGSGVGAEKGFHDDEAMASFIALFTSHDMDFDENLDYIPTLNYQGEQQVGNWAMTCNRCGQEWSVDDPQFKRCPNPKCGSIMVRGKQINNKDVRDTDLFSEMNIPSPNVRREELTYDEL